jgi:uncharacterized membrane protein
VYDELNVQVMEGQVNVALWVAAGVLAAAFLVAGVMKLVKPREDLQARLPYVSDFSAAQMKAIGAIEVAGATGLILPAVTKIATVLVPIAATGLAVTMVLATVVHLRRRENVAVNLVLLALAVFVAWGRFGPNAF